ncbi:hypothetical protein CHL67_03980 [Prosthecochloris sp. GSB1]|uniref:DUF2515 family protein n=1 Tax=Prosthecochloris sp. GSB1 TaxID=281093 RepID=UPI000B8CADE1|nr:hypothetical protein [Prosthecochloris sp. GSB1]ASQ91611.1 hypothetical protein CHL67_03980 [Prosthecochloris sp. GSB1]
MKQSREKWKNDTESVLPPCDRVVERNRAITSRYASFYLRNQRLFKWAGMAAFASNQVGVALAFLEIMQTPGRILSGERKENKGGLFEGIGDIFGNGLRMVIGLPLAALDLAARNLLLDDLEKIRAGNNNIYDDIAWAHAAYIGGGLAEIEANITENEKEFLLDGFRLIDEGASLLKNGGDSVRAAALVRKGNIKLLRHEQINTLQPVFDAISPQGRIVVSFGSEMNFGEGAPPGASQRASFADHFGYVETLTGQRSVIRPDDRWRWIEDCVLPAWNAVDESFHSWKGVASRFNAMEAGETNLLQEAARFAATLSFLE